MFPRQGEQCPVVELSYIGYSPPKCTCNGSTQTHSRKYMILLECLHDMNEKVTHPFPLLEPSLTPSRMPKPSVRKYCFQNKRFLFSKTYYRVSVKSIGQHFEVNCWVILRNNHVSACKIRENSNFLKRGKMLISVKTQIFSRS